jgi:hypothetical protein
LDRSQRLYHDHWYAREYTTALIGQSNQYQQMVLPMEKEDQETFRHESIQRLTTEIEPLKKCGPLPHDGNCLVSSQVHDAIMNSSLLYLLRLMTPSPLHSVLPQPRKRKDKQSLNDWRVPPIIAGDHPSIVEEMKHRYIRLREYLSAVPLLSSLPSTDGGGTAVSSPSFYVSQCRGFVDGTNNFQSQQAADVLPPGATAGQLSLARRRFGYHAIPPEMECWLWLCNWIPILSLPLISFIPFLPLDGIDPRTKSIADYEDDEANHSPASPDFGRRIGWFPITSGTKLSGPLSCISRSGLIVELNGSFDYRPYYSVSPYHWSVHSLSFGYYLDHQLNILESYRPTGIPQSVKWSYQDAMRIPYLNWVLTDLFPSTLIPAIVSYTRIDNPDIDDGLALNNTTVTLGNLSPIDAQRAIVAMVELIEDPTNYWPDQAYG